MVKEILESASEAERQRRTVVERMESRRAMLDLHSGGGTSISKGTVLDPMRRVDDLIDSNAADSMLVEQLEAELDEAWQMVGGMSELGADDGAQVCCRHYLWLEGWGEIARGMGHTVEECRSLMEMTMAWADEIGPARLRQASLGKWSSVAPSRNRVWKSR